MHPGSIFKQKKTINEHGSSEDWISMLPNEILISILSRLTMKEAGRTSVLSCRWRYLWRFTSSLDFDNSQLAYGMFIGYEDNIVDVERCKFVNWVNKVLRVHKTLPLDGFRVCFDVDKKNHKCDLDRWMRLAFEKKAKRIEFDLAPCNENSSVGNYAITAQFLRKYNLNHLTVCHLRFVDLTAEVLEHILSSCPLLEVLSVTYAKSLVHAKVCGPSLKLKSLKIIYCHSLESVEISAVNLVSFKYGGPNVCISFKEVPCLFEVSFIGPYSSSMVRNIQRELPYLYQLKKLAMEISLESYGRIPKFPLLRNLNQLELVLNELEGYKVNWMSTFEVFPSLHKFSIQFLGARLISSEEKAKFLKWKSLKAKEPKQQYQHKCLKVFEFIGFLPSKFHIELGWYVLRNTLALEKIIIVPRKTFDMTKPDILDQEVKFATRDCIESLKNRMLLGVELVIL